MNGLGSTLPRSKGPKLDVIKTRIRSVIKFSVLSVLGSAPALAFSLRRIADANLVTVLNLHRVDDRHTSAYEAIRPDLFDELVGWLKCRFTVLAFDDLETTPSHMPPLILSFDDGYKDFIQTVAPILRKHNVRANQNIIPACAQSGLPPINVLMQDFIGQAPASLLREACLPGLPNGADPDNRVMSGLLASSALKLQPIENQKATLSYLSELIGRFDGFMPTPMMTIADIAEMATVHEIGTHSFEHATMAAETDEYVANDARKCREWHRDKLGLDPLVYAFPNGMAGPGHENIVLSAGYRDVLLVQNLFSEPAAKVRTRFAVYGTRRGELRYRSAGGGLKRMLTRNTDGL